MKLIAERVRRYALAGLAAILLLSISGCLFQGHRAEVAKRAQATAEAIGTTATAQAGLNAKTGSIVDAAHQRETAINTSARGYADAAQTALGASAPVPPDVLGPWASGIDGLRDEADRAHAGRPDDPGKR